MIRLKPLSTDILCDYHNDKMTITYPSRVLEHRHKNSYQPYFHDFENTYQILRGINHPNLVKILDFNIINNTVIICYEFLNGYWPLQFFFNNYIDKYKPTTEEHSYLKSNIISNFEHWHKHISEIELAVQKVSDLLSSNNLLHCDIAPNNIMWNKTTNICKIIDLKTIKSIHYYRANKMFSSESFKYTLLNDKLKVKHKYLNNITSPWR